MPVAYGTSLCSECEQKRRKQARENRDYAKEYQKRYSEEDKTYRKFYKSKEWQMTSRAYSLEVGHKCEECGAIGTDVHHIAPIQTKEGWKKRFDFDNLRLLCVRCHNKEHNRVFGR